MENRNFTAKLTLTEASLVKRALLKERNELMKQDQSSHVIGGDNQVKNDLRTINTVLSRDFS